MRTNSPSKFQAHEEPVIVLAGALRSGTTLLRLMLSEHPSICGPHEYDFLFDVLDKGGHAPDPKTLNRRLRAQRFFKHMDYDLKDSANYRDLLDEALRKPTENDRHAVLAIHRNFSRALTVFPNARFIHLIRDPRDVARSSLNMGWSGNLYHASRHWRETEEEWDRIAKQIARERQISVSYEQLVRDPEPVLRDICKMLQHDFVPGMIDGYAEKSTYHAPDSGLAEQWKTKLSDAEIALVEEQTSGLLEERGYTPDQPPLTLSPLNRLRLQLDDVIGRNRFGVRRFGASLVIKEKLSRWFGFQDWHLGVLDRIHRIEDQHDR